MNTNGIPIAVDFDGTVVAHEFPAVGADIPGAATVLRELVARGHLLILWTMRSNEHLAAAVDWYARHDIPLYGINHNPDQASWTSSPKAYAVIYIDDAALGAPLAKAPGADRAHVDWGIVRGLLTARGVL